MWIVYWLLSGTTEVRRHFALEANRAMCHFKRKKYGKMLNFDEALFENFENKEGSKCST